MAMTAPKLILFIIVMAAVSYIPRVIPFAFFRKPIKNKYVRSLLLYMPYGVLAAMVFPDVFYSTASLISAFAGVAVALLMAYKKFDLLPVAIAATAAVFLTEYAAHMFGIV